MRRRQCAVTDMGQLREVLQRCRVGRLATTGDDGYPYITPLNYVYHGQSIYFHCAHEGEKMRNMLRDDRVCFEVDIPLSYLDTAFDAARPDCLVHQFYHSVIIRGRAEVVCDLAEKVAALNALMASHEHQPGYAGINQETPAVAKCAVVAIRVERISGKSDLAQKASPADRQRIAEYLAQRGLPGDVEAAQLIRPPEDRERRSL